MKQNMGSADKVIRLLVAVVLILLYIFHVVTGVLGYVLLVVAVIFILTSIFGFCPIYSLLGIRTCKKQS